MSNVVASMPQGELAERRVGEVVLDSTDLQVTVEPPGKAQHFPAIFHRPAWPGARVASQ